MNWGDQCTSPLRRRSYSRIVLPASRRRTFNQTSTQQIKTGLPKAAGNVKNIAATEWLARQRQHRPSCTAKHFAFNIDLFKFNMAEGNQFQASTPTISKPKIASYLKPFLASRNTFHLQYLCKMEDISSFDKPCSSHQQDKKVA